MSDVRGLILRPSLRRVTTEGSDEGTQSEASGLTRSRRIDWTSAERPQPYDPLSRINLGRSVEAELLRRDTHALASVPPFYGAGIYAIYFTGDLELYRRISGTQTPIYVGKAVPAGARKGMTDQAVVGHQLWSRIDEHRESIAAAEDLSVDDFRVRYLVADELFIPMAERLMIRGFQPVWNLVVDGFGNHDPGAGRRAGRRPSWDELHPGRSWSPLMAKPSKYTAEESRERIAAHFDLVPPQTGPGAQLPEPTVPDEAVPESAIDEGPSEDDAAGGVPED